jgi:polygalacturonase
MMRALPFRSFVLLVAIAGLNAAAQDTRKVAEPTLPPVCAVVKAQLGSPSGIDPQHEHQLDTVRIQQAIDNCNKGGAVDLVRDAGHAAFLTGPLQLRKDVTLLIDKNVTLYGSRDPRVYDKTPNACGKVDDEKLGCLPLITAKRASHSAIMGEGTIDGRGGAKLLVNNVEQEKTWWDLAEDARKGGRQQVPRMIDTDYTDDFTLYRITLKNSPNFHVAFHHGNGLTVWGIKIDTPQKSRNTDGIDPSRAKNVTITRSYIRAGDDNVAIKANEGGSKNISVIHNHFYWGHGMSIGSETLGGVSAVFVQDLSLDGPDNGIRIKSNPTRGGLVKNVTYEDVCIRKSKAPITLETAYAKVKENKKKEPVYEDILLRNVRVSGGGKLQLLGLDATHRITIQFDGVQLFDPNAKYKFAAAHADIMMGPGPVNFQLYGEDSSVSGKLGSADQPPPSCDAKFVPFPAE